jgi:hypothetical protein
VDEAEDVLMTDTAPQQYAAELFDNVKTFLSTFVVYPSQSALIAHVLWILHTYFMESWESTPRIAFLSPEPASGKSRALEVTEPLVPRPVHAVNASPAYLFRKVSDEDGAPTILFDEIDTIFGPKAKDNEDIRGICSTPVTARAPSQGVASCAARSSKPRNYRRIARSRSPDSTTCPTRS